MGFFDFFKKKKLDKLEVLEYNGKGEATQNPVYNLFFKYKDNLDYDVTIEPATKDELDEFKNNCKEYGVSQDTTNKLLDYYKMNNNFFNYFTCDDEAIFEWYEDTKELWLGQRDDSVFRYVEESGKFTIGDASNISFGEEYEFDSIMEMLESFISGKTV